MTDEKQLYRGFSTSSWVKGKGGFYVSNIDLVKEDLYNHIYTRFGDRVHMATYGTNLQDLTFEVIDPRTIKSIESDLTMVYNSDPRVEEINTTVYGLPNQNSIVAVSTLRYIEFEVTEDLHIMIAKDQDFIV